MDKLQVPSELGRNALKDPAALVDAAVWLIEHMCEHVGVSDLSETDVLDFGCGYRFTQAFLERRVAVKHYVGVDVSRPVVEFLQANVNDPRFEYVHLNARNERYNPTGESLSDLSVSSLEGRQFDVICLFSVFTHLGPVDYVAMLKLLRRFVKPDGRLFYTLFINETTDGGHGYIDRLTRSLNASSDSTVKHAIASRLGAPQRQADFEDVDPTRPLWVAMYSRRHALELINETGWNVLTVSPPDLHLQHHIVCAPQERGAASRRP